jgi:ADP-heptose:LPS heptosyltransferase
VAEPSVRVFLFGSRGDEATVLQQWEGLSSQAMSVAGRFTLQEELALMAHMDVMITMDSANMHLASLVGTRVVSVWGSTTPACGFMGYGQKPDNVLCLQLECQPCTIAGSKDCPRGTLDCLRKLQPRQLVRKILDATNETH